MSENKIAKRVESVAPAPKSEVKTSLSRRELLQKAGWVVPAVVIVKLSHNLKALALSL